MADPLKVECPHCNGSLKLKDRSSDGKKVRCPKCQEIFKIQLPEEDVLDDFEELSDDFGDDELPDEEPVIKAKSSKKPGKKKRKSNASQIPWGIIGIAAAALLSIGGLVVVIAQFAGSSGSNKIDLTYILPDANMVSHIKVQEMINSPLLAGLMSQPQVQLLMNPPGEKPPVNFKDMVSITFGAKAEDSTATMTKRMDPFSGQPGAGIPRENTHIVGVIRAAVPLPTDQFTNDKGKFTPQTHNGKNYFKKNGTTTAGAGFDSVDAFYFPEPTVMVVAMEEDMKRVIELGSKQVRRREFDIINPDMTVIVAAIADKPNDPNAIIISPANRPEMQALERAAHKTFRGGVAGVKISDRLDLEIVMSCLDAAGSAEVKTAADAIFADLKTKFEQSKTMLTLMDMNDVIGLAEKSLASIKVEQSGARVVAVATIPSELKAVGEALAKKIPGMAGMGMGGPGGAPPGFGGPPGSSGGLPSAGAGFDPSQMPAGALPPGMTLPPGATPAAP